MQNSWLEGMNVHNSQILTSEPRRKVLGIKYSFNYSTGLELKMKRQGEQFLKGKLSAKKKKRDNTFFAQGGGRVERDGEIN